MLPCTHRARRPATCQAVSLVEGSDGTISPLGSLHRTHHGNRYAAPRRRRQAPLVAASVWSAVSPVLFPSARWTPSGPGVCRVATHGPTVPETPARDEVASGDWCSAAILRRPSALRNSTSVFSSRVAVCLKPRNTCFCHQLGSSGCFFSPALLNCCLTLE